MWFLPAQFYVTSLSNDEPIAGANYLGFYLDVRRLREAIARDEEEVYLTSDGERYVTIRGDWEELSESKQSRFDIEDNAFRPLVGFIRSSSYPADVIPNNAPVRNDGQRFKVSLNLSELNRNYNNEETLIIAGRRQAFDRIRSGERAVGTLRIIATTDYPINAVVTLNYPRGI